MLMKYEIHMSVMYIYTIYALYIHIIARSIDNTEKLIQTENEIVYFNPKSY